MSFQPDFGADQVDRLRDEIRQGLADASVDNDAIYALVTVVDELVCNVLEHSKADWIELEMQINKTEVRMVLRDDGNAFDPIEAFGVASPATILENGNDRSLGLFMVSQLARSCQYLRVDGRVNVLNFIVALDKL